MKRRWVYQLLDEAPFPMLVLAFAMSQCPPLGADLKREPLAFRQPPAAVQVVKGSQRSLDSQGLLNELLSARRYRKSQLLALPGQ